jgi:hypothetical protein
MGKTPRVCKTAADHSRGHTEPDVSSNCKRAFAQNEYRLHSDDYQAATIIAKEIGLFRKHGLDVTMIFTSVGSLGIQAMGSDNVAIKCFGQRPLNIPCIIPAKPITRICVWRI